MIKSCVKVELLGISIDMKLSLDHHVCKIYHKADGQLNALKCLSSYLPFNARKVLVNAFIFLNFNYNPLVWSFLTFRQPQKMQNIQAS